MPLLCAEQKNGKKIAKKLSLSVCILGIICFILNLNNFNQKERGGILRVAPSLLLESSLP